MSPFNPTHVSHKQVEAYPIAAAEFQADGSGKVGVNHPEHGYIVVPVPAGFLRRPGAVTEGDMLVRYEPTAEEPNGYLSHSPRAVFEAGYAAVSKGSGLSFGAALDALKAGQRVFRIGWNGTQPGGFIPPSRAPIVYDGLCYILLACGQVAFCDAEDFDLVSKQQNWVSMKGYPSFTDYSEPNHPRSVRLHQLLFPDWPMADHENGDRLDNRRSNLRECTSAQNAQNSASRVGSSSQYKGVTWDRSRGRWLAAIQTEGKARTLGRFDDEAEAARAYDQAARAAYGRFARLNFPSVEPRMWLALSGVLGGRRVDADKFWSPHNEAFALSNGGSAVVLPCITMKTATGEILMGWLASQTDMLADDWMIVPAA